MSEMTLSEKRALAGSKGGRRTVKNKGKRWMKKIARLGAHAMHSKYRMEPVLLNDFALVHRATGEAVALISGRSMEDVTLPSFGPDPEYIEWID